MLVFYPFLMLTVRVLGSFPSVQSRLLAISVLKGNTDIVYSARVFTACLKTRKLSWRWILFLLPCRSQWWAEQINKIPKK